MTFLKKYKYLMILVVIILSIISIGFIAINNGDNSDPVLTIADINSSITMNTTDSEYIINGKVYYYNNTQLYINGVDVAINKDGSFKYKLELNVGKNNIEIIITKNGRSTKTIYVFNRTTKPNPAQSITNTSDSNPKSENTYYEVVDQSNQIEPEVIPLKKIEPTVKQFDKVIENTNKTPTMSSEKNILKFNCSIKCTTIINDNSVDVLLLESPGVDYSFAPIIETSPKSTIDPQSLATHNFNPVEIPSIYTVTAENGSKKDYSINIKLDPSIHIITIDTGSMSDYPWNESNCSMISYFSTGGADGNGSDGHGYGCRQSVSYVAWRIAKETGLYYSWGSAVNFTQNAINAGYEEGAPQPGSIAVMDPAKAGQGYGHVAWVEAVNGNTVTISQYNYNYGAGYGMYSMMNLSVNAFDHYVHIK